MSDIPLRKALADLASRPIEEQAEALRAGGLSLYAMALVVALDQDTLPLCPECGTRGAWVRRDASGRPGVICNGCHRVVASLPEFVPPSPTTCKESGCEKRPRLPTVYEHCWDHFA